MKTAWATTWKSSSQPRKQRKYVYNSAFHTRKKQVSAHLDTKLQEKLKKRSLPLKRGFEVKVMRGSKKGVKGKIARIELASGLVYIEGQSRDTISGNKSELPFQPSNLLITDASAITKKREVKKKDTEEKKESKETKKEEKTVKAEEKTPTQKEPVIPAIPSNLKELTQ